MTTTPNQPGVSGSNAESPENQPQDRASAPLQPPQGDPIVLPSTPPPPTTEPVISAADSSSAEAPSTTMSAVPQPAPSTGPVKHKLNQSYIWLGALRVLPYILIAILASSGNVIFDLATDSDLAGYGVVALILILVLLVAITGIVMLCRFISYKYIWYEYTNEEFSYFSGIFSKKRVHIPYARIQSINQKASLLQRVAGVCTVSIETAGGAENKAVILPYIEKSAAEALRKELFERKQLAQMKAAGVDPVAPIAAAGATAAATSSTAPATSVASAGNVLDMPAQFANDFRGVFGGDAIDTGKVTYEYGLTTGQLVLSAITGKASFGIVFASVIAGLTTLVSCLGFVLGTSEDEIYDSVFSLISYIPTSWLIGSVISLVGMFLGIMLIAWVVTVASACISYGGFHARRRGKRIETEFGIINHNFNGIDIERIQSIEITQSFFQRLLKSCTISLARVASATQDSSSDSKMMAQSRVVIHPFVKVDRVNEILENLLPEWDNLPATTHRLPKRATRRAITRRAILQGGGFWLAVVTFIVMFCLNLPLQFDLLSNADMTEYVGVYVICDIGARVLYATSVLLIIVDIIGAIMWRRGSGFGYDHAYVTMTNSGFSTDRTITPRVKVQMANLQTNPLQRPKHLMTISAITAAGVGNSMLKLIDVEEDDAKAWFAWCHPGGNRAAISSDVPLK